PAPRLARQLEVLEGLLRARGWAFDDAVVALPGAGTAAHVVTLPFTDARRIEQTISFEVEGQIPFELEEVAWDWQPLGARDGKTDLLVAVVRKEELAALLAGLQPAGLDPRAVLPAAAAYPALLGAAPAPAAPAAGPGPAEPARAEVILDLGQERTSVCVSAAGACEAARTFAFGAGTLSRALARELSLPEPEAAALVAAWAGGPPLPAALEEKAGDPLAAEALRRALVPLVRELRATLRAWRARVGPRPAGRLLLAGGSSRLPLLAELLAPEVDGPVELLAAPALAAERLGLAELPGMELALALALRAHQGSRAPRLNLRRGPLAYTRDFEHLKGRVARLGLYAALVLLLGVASAGVRTFALVRQEALLDHALCDAEQRILGKCYSNFEEAQAVFRGKGTAGAAVPKVSAVDVLAELTAQVPADVPLRLDRIEITRDKLHLEGTTDVAENVDKIVSGLKGSRCFGDAHSGSARKRASDGKFEFSVDSTLTCLEAPGPGEGGRG
ncbi:MAG TPA: type II secretion system protein GspL, partial [Anaeromyxobacter sp.]|nr:type II secretion system protein GspL [Anaeromyxobacter sp.]